MKICLRRQQIVHIPPENASRLPKLTLPHFSGDPVDWIHFWDSFSAAVDKKTSLSDIGKFTYLRSVLKGEAAATIAGFSLTATNYQNAVQLLTQSFGKDTVIINSYMNRLMKISPLKSGVDSRAMLDEIDSSDRGLQSMKVSSEQHYGCLLVSVLLIDKFPDDIKLLIGRKLEADELDWTLDNVLKVFRAEIETRERCGIATAVSTSTPEPRKLPQQFGSKFYCKSSAAALISPEKMAPKCTYCQKPHSSSECRTVTNIATRKQILRRDGCCYNCLRKNHTVRVCESPGKCFSCGRRHHVSICEENKPKFKSFSAAKSSKRREEKPESSTSDEKQEEGSKVTNNYVGIDNSVLLQTAQVGLINPNATGDGVQVRLVFDGGAQRSYISKKVQEALNLKAVKQ